ncbi:MAG TPA: TIR domain-containing protein [Thermoanaerobaculia bacterium]|nr:TIR domain-containing protein [Thermoanaerobaculia bacterium]
MPSPINIFLCHKKILSREKDGRQVEQENARASILHAILQSDADRYLSWMDESEIPAGMAWETEIYKRLLSSDVLLVAIGPGTSKSEWVRREIALATALGIAIVPLGYDLSRDEFTDELRGLAISHIQGKLTQNIRFPAKAALLQEIHADLESARSRTNTEREKVLATLNARQSSVAPKAKDDQRAFSLKTDLGGSPINIHVASGDFTMTRGIDILVNSENDYMQMARAFEVKTLSALLRTRGSCFSGGKFVDTIQKELDFLLGDRMRPVQPSEVFVTSAGGPDSRLARENKVRYIFHVAAVQAVAADARVVPFSQPHQIEDCIRACLLKLLELNQANGVVSPVGSRQREEQERLAQSGKGISKSILFPLFGTGQGGSSTLEAIKPMLTGIRSFLSDPDHVSVSEALTDIYFAAFREPDVEIVTTELRATFL